MNADFSSYPSNQRPKNSFFPLKPEEPFFQAGIGFGPIEEGIVREISQQCISIWTQREAANNWANS